MGLRFHDDGGERGDVAVLSGLDQPIVRPSEALVHLRILPGRRPAGRCWSASAPVAPHQVPAARAHEQGADHYEASDHHWGFLPVPPARSAGTETRGGETPKGFAA